MDKVTTTTVYESAVGYIKDGYALIPVHGVTGDARNLCTCGKFPCGPNNTMAGKHPVRKGWTAGDALSLPDAYAIWVEECSEYNIGIRTGAPSGFFALDVEANGYGELEELEATHGALPLTRVHVTGGGGLHYLWKMPDFDVRNNAKKLAPYIDIRGDGGMIVAPPSLSGKGEYRVLADRPIADAPAWLLEWLRGQLRADFDPGELCVIEDLPQYGDLDAHDQRRCASYARAVLDGEAAAYAAAPPGTGNAALFDAACNILEVVQSPWNLLTLDDAVAVLSAARERRALTRPDGGQDVEEFRKTFQSAQGKVIGKGRALPPDNREALMFDPPSEAPLATDVSGAEMDDDVFSHPGATDSTSPVVVAPVDPVDAMLGRMLDRDALDEVPTPKPLIWDMLDLDSETWLIGAPGGFKSFVALDWAAHVATGRWWRGKRVCQGKVVYIAAEGAKGMRLRVAAWEATYGVRVEDLLVLPEPVQVADAEAWTTLVRACRRLKPVMVVIDTQARVTVGLEENSAKDMGVLVEGVRRLRAATGACVTVVHHTGRNGGDARGSSALDGAQDTEIRVDRPTAREERLMLTATISTDKQKDGDESEQFDIQMQVVDLGTDPEVGRVLTSLAIRPDDPFASPPKRPDPDHVANLVPHQAALLDALREHAPHPYGATSSELRRYLKERGVEIISGSAATALNALVNKGLICRHPTASTKFVLAEYMSD